jgi:hypothetical protein
MWVSAVREASRKIRKPHIPSGAATFFYGGREARERGSKKIF